MINPSWCNVVRIFNKAILFLREIARLICFEAGFFQKKKNIPRIARLSDFELIEINKTDAYWLLL